MIKKYLFLLSVPVFLLFACKKTNSNTCVSTGGVPTAAEITNLKNYLNSYGLTPTYDARGFYYQINVSGFIDIPAALSDSVEVKYKGSTTDGVAFDSTTTGTTRKFVLGQTILGWQYGVPLIGKGGSIDLYLPPSLGYACTPFPGIPAGSILIFHVDLVNY